MQVFKTFAKVAKKKFPNTITYFIVFFVLIIAMSFQADSSSSNQFCVSSVDICLIDEDQSMASQALCDYLGSIHHRVTLDSYDRESLQDNLYYYQIGYIVKIPSGFEERLRSGDYKNLIETSKRHDSASGYFVDCQIDAYLNSVAAYLANGFSLQDALADTNQSLERVPQVRSIRFADAAKSSGTLMYYFFQYLPYVALMILMCGLSPVLMTFHEKKIDARIHCSALANIRISSQLGLACFAYVFFIWIVFLVVAFALTGPSQFFSAAGLMCILNSGVFMLIATAIALLLGSFNLDMNIVNMVSNILSLGMSFLCGIFVPQSILGDKVLAIGRFLPAYWNVRVINMLSPFSDDTLSMPTYWMCIGIQLLFFAALFSVYLAVEHRKAR